MSRPLWPPEYVNSSVNVLLDNDVPDAAYRFYNKLRALSWGEDTFSINFERLMELTGLSRTRIYEYARILRLRRGLLSYVVRSNAFECSFAPSGANPGKRDLPSPLALTPIPSSKPVRKEQPKPVASRKTGIPKNGNLYPLAEALAEVCHMQLEPNRGRLFREAQQLTLANPPATPELLRLHYNGNPNSFWRGQDWRGKKGDKPNPATIRETWGQWEAKVLPVTEEDTLAETIRLNPAWAKAKGLVK